MHPTIRQLNKDRDTKISARMIGISPAMASLETVLHGLEQWGIKVINYTPSDEFLQYLRDRVLRDCVQLIPPNPDHDDYIDFSGSPYQG
jgi:hypothetical protein